MSAGKSRQPKRDRKDELLDEALEETFPASDPPALVGPGGGITTAEDAHREPSRQTTRAETTKKSAMPRPRSRRS